jgi:hypothetical protein
MKKPYLHESQIFAEHIQPGDILYVCGAIWTVDRTGLDPEARGAEVRAGVFCRGTQTNFYYGIGELVTVYKVLLP